MKAVIQRVKSAQLSIDNQVYSQIDNGLLILLGITHTDTTEDIEWLCKKIVNLRIFADNEGKMNLSVKDIEGDILMVSQFTLYASTKKGNRPSYLEAAPAEISIPLYEESIRKCECELGKKIKTGRFGADMQISLLNDGPVSIIIDTKDKK